jgi:subtilisin family serine protease
VTDGERFGPPAPFEPPAWVADGLGRPTGKGLLVGVIDSGWDRNCDDPRVLPGVGLVDPADDLAMLRTDDDHDRVGHGTACIHQILRIAPDARVIPIRVFGHQLETSPGTLQAGILYAIERGVNVVNLSLGTTLEGTLHPLYAACEKARRQGIIVVAAGHNSKDWSYPAIFENVIGVSAARFVSPYEYHYLPDEAMECQAWGVAQPVVWLGGQEQVKHGTSFAAPNITGIVCLLLERHPGAKLEDVRELLSQHATAVIGPPKKAARTRARRKPEKAAATGGKGGGTAAKHPSRANPAPAETPPSTAPRRRRKPAAGEQAPTETPKPRRSRARAQPAADEKAAATPAKKAPRGTAEKPASPARARGRKPAVAETPEPKRQRAKSAPAAPEKPRASTTKASRAKGAAADAEPSKAPRSRKAKT